MYYLVTCSPPKNKKLASNLINHHFSFSTILLMHQPANSSEAQVIGLARSIGSANAREVTHQCEQSTMNLLTE